MDQASMGWDADGDEDDRSIILSLLPLSRTEEGQVHFVASGTVSVVLRRLTSSPPDLLLNRLCFLRNICCGSAGREAFLDSGGLDRVASVLVRTPPITIDELLIILQILINTSEAGERYEASVWSRFFPNWFLEFSYVRDFVIVNKLCWVLDNCLSSTGSSKRMAELCEPGRGLPILLNTVFTISRHCQDYNEESWLDWLLFKVCVGNQYFLQVFQGLVINDSIDAEPRFTSFSREQAFLLKMLARYLNDETKDIDAISEDSTLGVLSVLNHAVAVTGFTFQIKSVVPTRNHDIDALGFSLNILKDTLFWEYKSSQTVVTDLLLSAGLLTLVLELLRGLESPEIVNKSMKDATEETVPASPQEKKEAAPGNYCPYVGFRADVVAVIAYCLYRLKEAQD